MYLEVRSKLALTEVAPFNRLPFLDLSPLIATAHPLVAGTLTTGVFG